MSGRLGVVDVAAERDAGDISVSAFVARALSNAGVRRVFGFPGGGSNLDVIEALAEVGIEYTLTRTETGAAFMASATAELTGAPGVVMVGNGPGALSTANVVAHARLDRVPLVVISDRFTEAERTQTGHQVLEQAAALRPLAKLSVTIDPATLPAKLAAALRVCREQPPGPVHLDFPRDLGKHLVGHPNDKAQAQAVAPIRSGDLDPIAQLLGASSSPLVLAGLEVTRGVPPADFRALVERLQAPVLTTYKAKGILPETHPLWAGIITGGHVEDEVLEAADAILAVGFDTVELLARPWTATAPVASLRAADSDDGYLAPVARRVGSLGSDVRELIEHLAERPRATAVAATVRAYRERVIERLRLRPDEPLTAWRIVEVVRAMVPDDALLAVDAGAHMLPAGVFWRALEPGRFLISNGHATMGFALPSAIAAAMLEPERVVVAFTGDGGLAYHVAELETAARMGAKVIAVVFNDSSLSLIRVKQEASGRRREPLDFGRARFDDAAVALGVDGRSAVDVEQLEAALRWGLASERTVVIDAQLTGNEYGDTVAIIRG